MQDILFRKKNLDKISSPEQLNDYIQVTNPSVWLILGGLIILLIGTCIWGVFGTLVTSVDIGAVIQDQKAFFYLSENMAQTVQIGDEVGANGKTGTIAGISEKPFSFATVCKKLNQDEYAIHVMGLTNQTFYYEVTADFPGAEDGIFQANIITERLKPITFIVN